MRRERRAQHEATSRSPPGFRPAHFTAVANAKKQVFMEKPIAVDAPGYRAVQAAGREAAQTGLCVAVGLNLRHAQNHRAIVPQIHDGLIGELLLPGITRAV
jgi:myo-inositol 2-dehydrogenase/D-chiro-inositol 1-dehydrogenase